MTDTVRIAGRPSAPEPPGFWRPRRRAAAHRPGPGARSGRPRRGPDAPVAVQADATPEPTAQPEPRPEPEAGATVGAEVRAAVTAVAPEPESRRPSPRTSPDPHGLRSEPSRGNARSDSRADAGSRPCEPDARATPDRPPRSVPSTPSRWQLVAEPSPEPSPEPSAEPRSSPRPSRRPSPSGAFRAAVGRALARAHCGSDPGHRL